MRENGLEGQIEVMLWESFNKKVDVIIGEPMGYTFYFDGLLDKMLIARDQFLSKNGLILPATLAFKGALIND